MSPSGPWKSAVAVWLLACVVAVAEPGRAGWKVRKDARLLQAALQGARVKVIDDLKEINVSELTYDAAAIKDKSYAVPPWERKDISPNFKAYRSPTVTAHMTRILSKTVEGLNVTFLDVFRSIRTAGCLTYVLGGEVRDAVLGIESLDTDIAFTCTADFIAEVCAKHGWQFKHRQGVPYISIGSPEAHDEGLEGKDAYTSLDAPNEDHEYSCNTLFWDWENEAILDPTGNGAKDTQEQVVRIPGIQDLWDKWAAKGNWGKLLRLWKLRIPPKSFNASEDTFFYLLGELRSLMANGHEADIKKNVQKFFKSYASRAEQFAKQMRIDLGSTWFDSYIAPEIPPSARPKGEAGGLLLTAVTCDKEKDSCTTVWGVTGPAGVNIVV